MPLSLRANTQSLTASSEPPNLAAVPGKQRRNSGRSLTHLATRVFNAPLAIRSDKGDIILSVLGPRLGISAECLPVVSFDDDFDDPTGDELGYTVQNSIAVIPIFGTLVKRASGMDAMSGMTSYEEITSQIKQAMADSSVKGILMDVDSPGGESAGMFDLCDMIYGLRGTKPIYSVSNDSMYSAAYALGSCADQVYVAREGGTGSIGCYMLHVDQSGYDKQKGLKFTYIHAGDRKVDGNPHEPLAKDARAELQAEVNRQRDMFVTLVSRNRNCTAQQIMDLQAGCLYGAAGVPLLADKVGSRDNAMADLMAKLGIDPDEDMADDPKPPEEDLSNPLAANVPFSYTSPDGKFTISGFSTGTTTGSASTFTIAHFPEQAPHATEESVLAACAGIKKLNGARTAATMSAAERDRQYAELAAQVKAGGKEPEPLKSEAEIAEALVPFEWKDECLIYASYLNSAKPVGWAQYDYSDAESEQLFGHTGAILAVRLFSEARSSTPADGRKISILAVPYNDLCTIGGIKERYERGCFSEGLNSDPRVLWNHDEACVLGRKSAGTARFYEDADGVHAEADAPATQWADDLLTSMRRGDVTGASAAFWILQSRWEMRGSDRVRVIEKALMREASVHAFPAYESTTATVSTQASVSEPALSEAPPAYTVTELDRARLAILSLR